MRRMHLLKETKGQQFILVSQYQQAYGTGGRRGQLSDGPVHSRSRICMSLHARARMTDVDAHSRHACRPASPGFPQVEDLSNFAWKACVIKHAGAARTQPPCLFPCCHLRSLISCRPSPSVAFSWFCFEKADEKEDDSRGYCACACGTCGKEILSKS